MLFVRNVNEISGLEWRKDPHGIRLLQWGIGSTEALEELFSLLYRGCMYTCFLPVICEVCWLLCWDKSFFCYLKESARCSCQYLVCSTRFITQRAKCGYAMIGIQQSYCYEVLWKFGNCTKNLNVFLMWMTPPLHQTNSRQQRSRNSSNHHIPFRTSTANMAARGWGPRIAVPKIIG